MTVSSRFANHLKTLNDYNQSFNLRRPLSKVNRYFKKLNYKLGKLDVRELDYKPFSLTSRLIVELEKIPRSSKVKKAILKMVSIAAAQFAVIVDIITLPARHYRYLKVVAKNKERIVHLNDVAQIFYMSITSLLAFSVSFLRGERDAYIRGYTDSISSSNNFLLFTTILFGVVSIFTLHKGIGNNLQARLQNPQLETIFIEDEDAYIALLNNNLSLKDRIERLERERERGRK